MRGWGYPTPFEYVPYRAKRGQDTVCGRSVTDAPILYVAKWPQCD
jgi:hypothetical protein